jgi:hypothetical protein
MALKETGCENVERIQLALDKVQLRAFANRVTNLDSKSSEDIQSN